MSTYALLEPLLVSLIVAACAGAALRRMAPQLLARIGNALRTAGVPDWLCDLCGKPTPAASGCSNGCSSCNNCPPAPIQNKQIVVLHRSKPRQST